MHWPFTSCVITINNTFDIINNTVQYITQLTDTAVTDLEMNLGLIFADIHISYSGSGKASGQNFSNAPESSSSRTVKGHMFNIIS